MGSGWTVAGNAEAATFADSGGTGRLTRFTVGTKLIMATAAETGIVSVFGELGEEQMVNVEVMGVGSACVCSLPTTTVVPTACWEGTRERVGERQPN
jgi:hypothetical protein